MGANDWRVNDHVILAPTTGKWMRRKPLGVQGDARPIYPGVYSFELRWQLMSHEEWSDLVMGFRNIQWTGTNTVRIPCYPTATGSAFAWCEYSGTVFGEPSMGSYFETYPTSVVLIITNIVID